MFRLPNDIPEAIYSSPIAMAVLTVILIGAVHFHRGLSYREAVVLEGLKARVSHGLETHLPVRLPRIGRIPSPTEIGRPLTRELHVEDHIATLAMSPREIITQIRPPADPNPLTSTAKYRIAGGDVQWVHSQWAIRYEHDGDPWQCHVILLQLPDGRTAIYVHDEPDTITPEAHTGGEQLHGDARGVFGDAFQSQSD